VNVYSDDRYSREELKDLLRERTQQLEKMSNEVESLAYMVSADIRAPLRAINGFCYLLLEEKGSMLEKSNKECLERISAASQRMGFSIDHLLVSFRLICHQVIIENFDLAELVREIEKEYSDIESERTVTIQVPQELPVEGDRQLLRALVCELLGNAVKHARGKSHRTVQVGTTKREGKTYLFVDNTDWGDDIVLPQNMDMHHDRETQHTRIKSGAYGFELANVARIVEKHGGQMWIEGTIEKGASVYFSLGQAPEDCTRSRGSV